MYPHQSFRINLLTLSCPPMASTRHPARGIKDCDTARKVQKADPEKLRRDRLNEQFLELGNALGKSNMSVEEQRRWTIII
ncbi:uncharacterized protein LOC120005198 isoform X3 [Tripterygium wilfordii]|uniref:uncharacterized protein LOC120005198 isoform X3 n=1 Tax=Tripterygium wilfordii TaxID=458696 RepID=UPI0018F80DCE|nr:uncharacterized protein LOC120005198 isoform X3 [Tripterygium wilfordii]